MSSAIILVAPILLPEPPDSGLSPSVHCGLSARPTHSSHPPPLQDEGGSEGDVIGAKLRPIADQKDYEALVASGAPVMVDFYAP